MQENGDRKSVSCLTSLTFLATGLIVLFHSRILIPWHPDGIVDFGLTYLFVSVGFFISLQHEKPDSLSACIAFIRHRIARLYPLHILTFLLSLPLCWPLSIRDDLLPAIKNIFLVHSWSSSHEVYFSFNSVSWMLSSLVFSYGVVALVLLKPRRWFIIALAGSLLSLFASAYYLEQQNSAAARVTVWLMYLFPPNRLFNVLCGMGAGHLFIRLYRAGSNHLGLLSGTTLEILALGLVLERLCSGTITGFAKSVFFSFIPWLPVSGAPLFESYVMSALLSIGLLSSFGFRKGMISRTLEKKYFVSLGSLSLAMYLSHQLVFRFLAVRKDMLTEAAGETLLAAGSGALVILTALVLHIFVEKPRARFIEHFESRVLITWIHDVIVRPGTVLSRIRIFLTEDLFGKGARIETIDSIAALRFFGMIVVMLHHINFLLGWRLEGLNFILSYFFVSSGFAVYLGSRRFSQVREAGQYLWSRLSRIYPVYFFMFFISIYLVYLEVGRLNGPAALMNLLLIQSWSRSPDVYFSFNAVSWFVSTLLFSYLVFAVIMFKPHRLFYVALFIALISVILTTAFIEHQENPSSDYIYSWYYIFPPNRVLSFLSGAGAAIVFARYYAPLRSRLGMVTATMLEVIALVLVLDRIIFRNTIDFIASWVFFLMPCLPHTGYFLLDDYICSALIINILLITFGLEKGLLSRLLSTRIFVFLGGLSFSIFMSHQLVFRFVSFGREFFIRHYGVTAMAVGACVITIPVAYLIHRYIEVPGSRKLKRFKMSPAYALKFFKQHTPPKSTIYRGRHK